MTSHRHSRAITVLTATVLTAALVAGCSSSTSEPEPSSTVAASTSAAATTTTSTLAPIPSPLGDDAVSIAVAAALALNTGTVATEAGTAQTRVGSTLTTVWVPLEVEGVPIASPPVRVTIDHEGEVVASAWDATGGWEQITRVASAGPTQADVALLAGEWLAMPDMVVEAGERLWVPVGAELREGWRLTVADTSGTQRFDVLVDATTMTVVSATPLATVQSADDCPEPDDAPSACVGGPSPDIATLDRPLTGLDDESGAGGLVGDHARVVLVPGGSDLPTFDLAAASPADFADRNGRWGGDSEDIWFPAANAYYWITRTTSQLADDGFDELVSDPVMVGVTHAPLGAKAFVYPSTNHMFFGSLDTGHAASDAQVVVHELGHWLLNRSAPELGGSLWAESTAFNEANADIVSFLMTVSLDLPDPGCFSPYLGADLGRTCLRRLDGDETYPADALATNDQYVAGRVWASAMYDAFVALVADAGGTVDECLPGNACAGIADRLLHTLAEAWPMMNSRTLTMPDAAAAVLVANDHLGLLDAAILRDALSERGLVDADRAPRVTLTLQHPDPAALTVTIDVIDSTGSVLCQVADGVPGSAVITVDAAPCVRLLPAAGSQVWRARFTSAAATAPGRVLEFAITTAEDRGAPGGVVVRPSEGTLSGLAGATTVVTIPDGADTDLGSSWVLDGVQLLSGIGLDEDAQRVVAVAAGAAGAGPLLTGFDAATGAVVWQNYYSYGSAYEGMHAGFVMADGMAISLTHHDTQVGVAGFALGDGAERWFTVVDQPFSLSTCGSAVCVASATDGTRLRLDLASGAVLGPVGDIGADELPIAPIGEDLVSMTEGSTPVFRRWDPDTGSTVWTSTPAAELAADTSGGWNTMYRDDLGLYIASIGPTSDILSSTPGYTVALAADTGAVQWVVQNAWVPESFPDVGPLYVMTYDAGFGLGSQASGIALERLDPQTGRTLATVSPAMGDPLQLTYLIGLDGTSVWWRDPADGSIAGGHDMQLNLPLDGASAGIAWEVVPRDAITVNGTERNVPDGFRAIDLELDEPIATRQRPSWVGVRGARWSAFLNSTGGLSGGPV
ncbi:MAG: hypothetical protein Q7V88_13500 [Actinomycetota bacterium]|nr:hypothetical protein [Actinomycetota bacterium]